MYTYKLNLLNCMKVIGLDQKLQKKIFNFNAKLRDLKFKNTLLEDR